MASKSSKVTFVTSTPKPTTSVQSSSSIVKPRGSATTIKRKPCPAGFVNIPALSIRPKTPPIDPVLERLKRKTIRRNAPAGEDLKQIKDIIRGIKGEVVTVQEYVGLVSPYTGDRGNTLCSVMIEDLSHFRKMVKRVYDTMTEDVSDVLANEQMHLTEFYNERTKINKDRIERAYKEIYSYVPNFNFNLYYKKSEIYLDALFPLPKAALQVPDEEEEDMQRRQMAYHRLQWLRSEGTRLSQENAELQARLKELKKLQNNEQMENNMHEKMIELQRSKLEETQADLQDQVKDLNKTIEESIIDVEEEMRTKRDLELKKSASETSILKRRSHIVRSKEEVDPWNVKTAKLIENTMLQECAESTLASESGVSIARKKPVVNKLKSKARKRIIRPEWKDTTPPTPQEVPDVATTKQVSPFHYSPPKSPTMPAPSQRTSQQPEVSVSQFHYSPPKSPTMPAPSQRISQQPQVSDRNTIETITIVTSETTIEETSKQQFTATPRRSLAPRDTWGGYY